MPEVRSGRTGTTGGSAGSGNDSEPALAEGGVTAEAPGNGVLRINMNAMKTFFAIVLFAGSIAGGIAAGATWKANLDNHLSRIEGHLRYADARALVQDCRMDWLIAHERDKNTPGPNCRMPKNAPTADPEPDPAPDAGWQ